MICIYIYNITNIRIFICLSCVCLLVCNYVCLFACLFIPPLYFTTIYESNQIHKIKSSIILSFHFTIALKEGIPFLKVFKKSQCTPMNGYHPQGNTNEDDYDYYNPFNIRSRKKTSRMQLEVLENSYRENSRPDGRTRKMLGDQLGMTPRCVQVWFQNRRAKEKKLTERSSRDFVVSPPEYAEEVFDRGTSRLFFSPVNNSLFIPAVNVFIDDGNNEGVTENGGKTGGRTFSRFDERMRTMEIQ